MHDDTDWFRGYVAGLEEAERIIRYGNLGSDLNIDTPKGIGLLINYLDAVKLKQCPWPTKDTPDGTR